MVVESNFITRPTAPDPSLDFDRLYQEGLKHIEALSGKIWTDYNSHDPGISILEVLCYAITELGYRCEFAIGDIISPLTENDVVSELFNLASVASSAPLTINDYRKRLIDLPGYRNAWLEKVEQAPLLLLLDRNVQPPLLYNPGLSYQRQGTSTTTKTQTCNDDGYVTGTKSEVLSPTTGLNAEIISKTETRPITDVLLNENMSGLNTNLRVNLNLLTTNTAKDNTIKTTTGNSNTSTVASSITEVNIKGLYDVFLQFEEHPDFGDLNDNSITHTFKFLTAGNGDQEFPFTFEVEFPAWENQSADLDVIKADIDHPALVKGSLLKLAAGVILPNNGETLSYSMPLLLNPDDRAVTINLVLRVVGGQEKVVNPTEFSSRLREQFHGHEHRFYNQEDILGGQVEAEILPNTAIALIMRFLDRRKLIQQYLEDARHELAKTRNLCEDFNQLYPMNLQEIGLEVVLDVVPGTDMDRIMAEVYRRTEVYLSPTVRFYSLREMLEKGYAAEEIFRGPRLRNGFIDEHEPAFNMRRDRIYTSDLLSEFMKIDGVRLVRRLALSRFIEGRRVNANALECLFLDSPGRYLTRLNINRSSVTMDAGNGRIEKVNPSRVLELLSALKAFDRLKGRADETEFDLPTTQIVDLQTYYTIQNEFPANYGIGIEGVPSSDVLDPHEKQRREERSVQAKQLKAYLLFFDQLLANFHAQLAHIRDLYSHSVTTDRTYFTQALFEVPRVKDLLHDFTANTGETDLDWAKYLIGPLPGKEESYYPTQLQTLAEDQETFQDRRKRFLDHLLARYNESFSEYASYVFSRTGAIQTDRYSTLIKGQERFLEHYVEHSASRGAGFDYQKPLDRDFPNGGQSYFQEYSGAVTGLKKRIVYLTDLPKLDREFINPYRSFKITQAPDTLIWSFVVFKPDTQSDPEAWFSSIRDHSKLEDVLAEIDLILQLVAADSSYEGGPGGQITVGAFEELATYGMFPESFAADYPDATKFLNYLSQDLQVENLHIVEHIILRQRASGDPTLRPRIIPCCPALDIVDPYSFRVSVVLPTWSGRFQDLEFRRLFKRLLRLEAPAHVYIHFYWIDKVQMYHFENCWNEWLEGEWLAEDTRLLWEDDKLDESARTLQENKYFIVLDRRAASGTEKDFFVNCLAQLRNLYDCHYEVLPSKLVESYKGCDLLAFPVDPDGEITQAWLADNSPALPSGMCLDACNGEIRVNPNTLLLPGTYILQVVTVNSGGELTHNEVVILIRKNTTSDAVVEPALDVCKYKDNDVLITFTDQDGDLVDGLALRWFTNPQPGVNAETIQNSTVTPPPGIAFDRQHHKVIVSRAEALVSGTYGVTVWLADEGGGDSTIYTGFEILGGGAPLVQIFTPADKYHTSYLVDDLLIEIGYRTNNVTAFKLKETLLTEIGLTASLEKVGASKYDVLQIRILDQSLFRKGLIDYFTRNGNLLELSIAITTSDDCGYETQSNALLKVFFKDSLPVFSAEAPKEIKSYLQNDLLGTLSDYADGCVRFVTPAPKLGLTTGFVSKSIVPDLLLTMGIEITIVGLVAEFRIGNLSTFAEYVAKQVIPADRKLVIAVPVIATDCFGSVAQVVCNITVFIDAPNIGILEAVDEHNGKALDTYLQGIRVITLLKQKAVLESVTFIPLLPKGLSARKVNDGTIEIYVLDPKYLVAGATKHTATTLDADNITNSKVITIEMLPLAELQVIFELASMGPDSVRTLTYSDQLPGVQITLIPVPILPVNFGSLTVNRMQSLVFREGLGFNNAKGVSTRFNGVNQLGQAVSGIVRLRRKIVEDPEILVTPVKNGQLIDEYLDKDILYQISKTEFTGETRDLVSIAPASWPIGIDAAVDNGIILIYVVSAIDLVVGETEVAITTTDVLNRSNTAKVNISILEGKIVALNYEFAPGLESYPMPFPEKYRSLRVMKVSSFIDPQFGEILLNDGIDLVFREGKHFAASTKGETVNFIGIARDTNAVVRGTITITPLLSSITIKEIDNGLHLSMYQEGMVLWTIFKDKLVFRDITWELPLKLKTVFNGDGGIDILVREPQALVPGDYPVTGTAFDSDGLSYPVALTITILPEPLYPLAYTLVSQGEGIKHPLNFKEFVPKLSGFDFFKVRFAPDYGFIQEDGNGDYEFVEGINFSIFIASPTAYFWALDGHDIVLGAVVVEVDRMIRT